MNDIHVVIPHYGDTKYLKAAVHSVLAQEDKAWRLTVVDDDSTDLGEWFTGLGDDRVTYLRNERNLGLNANFQRCLEVGEGDLLTILGNDDLLLPNYVGAVRRGYADFPGTDVLQPGVEVIDSAGQVVAPLVDKVKAKLCAPKVDRPTVIKGEELAVGLLRGNWTYFPSLCWRRETLLKGSGFQEGLDIVLDLALLLELLENGGEMLVVPETAFQYRRHGESASSSAAALGGRFVEEGRFFRDVAARMEARGWPKAAKAARGHLTSRLHALTLLPSAVVRRQGTLARVLAGHAFGSGETPRP